MKAVVTGTSTGIGRAVAVELLRLGHDVIGIDIQEDGGLGGKHYTHYIADVADRSTLPEISGVNILINNAGTQEDATALDVNLRGTITCTELYGIQPDIEAIVNIASTSGHNGAEFPRYAASKGGVLSYTKYTAMAIAKYGATCNSISPGGVITGANAHILDSAELFKSCLNETLLGRWATAGEIARWVCFLALENRSMTGQDIIIDNGELAKFNFVW